MRLLGSVKSNITKDKNGKNGKNMIHLEITKVVLIHYNAVSNDCKRNSRSLYSFVPNK